jgi:cellulose synthase/poly-beta-1,6-N-acetylglucosamine synthase-like glycosyltransferase
MLAPFTLLTLCFAVELFVGLRPLRPHDLAKNVDGTAVIVVPAHDEEGIIAASLSALKTAAAEVRILVVADNCTDRTAEVVRTLGIDVIERFDAERRGKGFALDFARDSLRQTKPDVVVILDADCTSDAASIANLIARCAATGRPCQAVNLQYPNLQGAPTVQLSTFAFFIKNVIRQRALQRLAGRVHLLGTGMALPWPIFDGAALATDNIVEDLQLGVQLAETGHQPLFVEEASVWSNPETEKNTLVQRRRWEGGFLQSAWSAAPQVLRHSLSASDARGFWAAINLMIPPLALLVFLDLAALLVATVLAWLVPVEKWPPLVLGASLLLACIGLVLAWAAGGRRFVTLSALARIPLYVVRKLPMYVGFVRGGAPKDWIRTRGG